MDFKEEIYEKIKIEEDLLDSDSNVLVSGIEEDETTR